jgi:ATP-dependent Lhr-like helicase
MRGLVDFGRIEEMTARINGRIDLIELPRVSPLAAPLLLEMGRVPVKGLAEEKLLAQEAERLISMASMTADQL